MDKKAVLAVVLSVGIWIGWQKLYWEPIQKQAMEQAKITEQKRQESLAKTVVKTEGNTNAPRENPKAAAPITSTFEPKVETFNASQFEVGLSNGPELFANWTLSGYYKTLTKSEGKVDLSLISGFPQQFRIYFKDENFEALNLAAWTPFQNQNGTFVSNLRTDLVDAVRSVKPSDEFFSDVNYQFSFKGQVPAYIFIEMLGSPQRPNDKEGSIWGEAPDKVHFTYRDGEGRHSVVAASLKEAHESVGGVRWFGIDTRYFVFALVPGGEWKKDSGTQIVSGFENGKPAVFGRLVIPTQGKKELTVPLRVFFGPKHFETLQSADTILTDTIDFGWTSFIAVPILRSLKWLYGYLGNYGLAIIVLTFIIKMLLYPLTYKSMKSMSKMAKLQPQLNALREKYKDDKEKLNSELMGFMKTHGYNPVGGCLPILLQMPIFFALYRVLFNSIELYQAPFGLWIHDLSVPDPYFITPVLLTGLMYFQQKLSPTAVTDPAQQKMMQIMPVLFGFFMLLLPAGLTIYMVVNSVVSIAQQWFLNHKFGVYDNTGIEKLTKKKEEATV